MSRPSERGPSAGRGLYWAAVRCPQWAEPWAQAGRGADPQGLINLGNATDSGSTLCICQGIKYVHGKECNYSIFRDIIRVISCTNFLIMLRLLIWGFIWKLSKAIVLGCTAV